MNNEYACLRVHKHTVGAIKNEHSRETGNKTTNKTKTQHNMYWTPLGTNKHR
jgi:hypothetical protein